MARLAFGKEILCDRIQQSVSPCIFVLLRTKALNSNPSSRGQSHKMARRNLLYRDSDAKRILLAKAQRELSRASTFNIIER